MDRDTIKQLTCSLAMLGNPPIMREWVAHQSLFRIVMYVGLAEKGPFRSYNCFTKTDSQESIVSGQLIAEFRYSDYHQQCIASAGYLFLSIKYILV
jgi:hypothetical protein